MISPEFAFFIEFLSISHILRLMKQFTSPKQRLGEFAEGLACRYLEGKGFHIIERNYTRRCGEIDIIAQRNDITHFIEVKCVSREIRSLRPEDHVDISKLRRLSKTIFTYMCEHDMGAWQFDVMCLIVDQPARKARVYRLEALVLPEN
jgi:putative endonuclease